MIALLKHRPNRIFILVSIANKVNLFHFDCIISLIVYAEYTIMSHQPSNQPRQSESTMNISLSTVFYIAFYLIIAFLFYTFVSGFMGMLDNVMQVATAL